jgi:mannose/fructose/N-acetylgalactosamine-specific phosphotransferase system component IID
VTLVTERTNKIGLVKFLNKLTKAAPVLGLLLIGAITIPEESH